MSYLTFLVQWYNWPYLAGLLLLAASLARPAALVGLGSRLGGWLGVGGASGLSVLRAFSVSLALVGLTLNGGLHDYWPAAQERGFLPGFVVTLLIAAAVARWVGRIVEEHFPEIKAVSWGARGLSGHEGRVVSRVVSADYRAGRAQVAGDEETVHIVMCKTRGDEIPFGAMVALGEYDEADGRYYVEPVDAHSGEREVVDVERGE